MTDLADNAIIKKIGFDTSAFLEVVRELSHELTLDELIAHKREIKEVIDMMEEAGKRLSDHLVQQMCEAGKKEHVTAGGLRAEMIIGRSASKLDDKMLVERGVSPDVIRECTRQGAEYTYVKVTRPTSTK